MSWATEAILQERMIGLGVLLEGLQRARGATEGVCHVGQRRVCTGLENGGVRKRRGRTIRRMAIKAFVL